MVAPEHAPGEDGAGVVLVVAPLRGGGGGGGPVPLVLVGRRLGVAALGGGVLALPAVAPADAAAACGDILGVGEVLGILLMGLFYENMLCSFVQFLTTG